VADYLTIAHEVAEFTAWKSAYDGDAPNRKAAGLTDLILVRESANRNMVGLVFGCGDVAKARAMMTSERLREVMTKAGVVGMPTMHLRRGEFTSMDAATFLTVNCRIDRGFETFRKGYAMDKADRVRAGLTDLALLQDIDDPNDLFLSWSVADVAKAMPFLQSPALAEHQSKNCGIVGKPVARFWTK
jgi:hypothetical protein